MNKYIVPALALLFVVSIAMPHSIIPFALGLLGWAVLVVVLIGMIDYDHKPVVVREYDPTGVRTYL